VYGRWTKKGFTIVELVVVCAIIGLLVGILLPGLSKAQRHARQTVTKANLRGTGLALLEFYGDHRGRYPISLIAPDGTSTMSYCPDVYNSFPETLSEHTNIFEYLGRKRVTQAAMLHCPQAPASPSYLERLYEEGDAYDANTPSPIDLAFGTYCFWMNWVGARVCEENGVIGDRRFQVPRNETEKGVLMSCRAGIGNIVGQHRPRALVCCNPFVGGRHGKEITPPDSPPLWYSGDYYSASRYDVPGAETLPGLTIQAVWTDGAVHSHSPEQLAPVVLTKTIEGRTPLVKCTGEIAGGVYTYGIYFVPVRR